MNIAYFNYLLCKPFHSYKYKKFKEKSKRLVKRKNLYRQTLEEVSKYTNECLEVIEHKHKTLFCEVENGNFDSLSEEQLKAFYINCQHYIYELPLWNASSGRPRLIAEILAPYIKRNKYINILDWGAGAGDLCIELVTVFGREKNIYYFDVNKQLINFSRWRFISRDLNIAVIEKSELDKKKFDCIVSFDVFEHFKNLPSMLKEIACSIVEGGSLVFNIELSGDGSHLVENKVYADSRQLDIVLNKAGFVFDWKFKRFFFYKKI